METRRAVHGSAVSRWVVAVALVLGACGLGASSALGLHELGVGAGSAPSGRSTVTFVSGPAWDDSSRRHGNQSLDGSQSPAVTYRAPREQGGGPRD
jgi:hypothetical protein